MQTLRHVHTLKRNRFLVGTGTALAIMLAATSAQAQTSTNAMGIRTLANDQVNSATVVRADANEPAAAAVIAGPIDSMRLEIADNAIETSARANDADQRLGAVLTGSETYGSTRLIAGRATVDANGATVVANRQAVGSAAVESNIYPAALRITTGRASSSVLTLSGNTMEAAAAGNEAVADIGLTGTLSAGGAGIAAHQSTGAGSSVGARSRASTELSADAPVNSMLDNSSNLDRATAYANSADNRIAGEVTVVIAPADSAAASGVPVSGTGDPQVAASFGILSNQVAGGSVKTRAGDFDGAPTFRTIVQGTVAGSSITSDANGLSAVSAGNRSTNGIFLAAGRISDAPGAVGTAPGAVANVTNVQRAEIGNLTASTTGGTAVELRGTVLDTTVSASANSIRSNATGNQAAGNQVEVRAGSIDAVGGNGSITPRAAALVDPTGGASIASALGVQNVQDFGHSVIAAGQLADITQVAAQGIVARSTVGVETNDASALAAGNSATDLVDIEAISVRTHAAVNSLQTGNGTVTATMGGPTLRGGASIFAEGGAVDSRLFVANNSLTGTAIGNSGSNDLVVSASTVHGFGSSAAAEAGPVNTGYGAAGTFALASNQKLGEPTAVAATPRVAGTVFGAFGISDDSGFARSSAEITGNAQRANALGNTGLNRLEVTSASLEDGVTASLSAFQYGQATIVATSDATLTAPRLLNQSRVSVTGNSSVALAVVNDTDNGLSISGARTGGTGTAIAQLEAEPLGPPAANGDNVLANQQFAAGSVGGYATLSMTGNVPAGGLTASSFTVADNVVSAEASANRARNTVKVQAPSGGVPGTGLVSGQGNIGQVNASASADWGYGPIPTGGMSATGSSITIDGNAVSALARGNAAENAITISTGTAGTNPSSGTALDRFVASVEAPVALLNTQSNYGVVSAAALETSAPLNAPGIAGRSSIELTGNSIAASAYGNAASNAVSVSALGQAPGTAIASTQTNYGNVSAFVTGPGLAGVPGPMSSSAFSITGNQLAASAVGNQVSSAITTPR